ncbi:MAG: hypothetical protein WA784_02885 [Albidovulum sp.]|jgi:hypothetical protein
MPTETFEYRRQARGPKNYIALWITMLVLYFASAQGWGFMAAILCGPFLGMIIVRLVLNEAEGFRLNERGVEYYSLAGTYRIKWRDLRAVVISGDGLGGAKCLLHTTNGASVALPATDAFSPDRLGQEFKTRNVPIWRAELEDQNAAFSAQH